MTILNKINNYKNKDYLKIHTITLLLIWGLGIGDCPIPNPQSPIPKLIITQPQYYNITIIQ